MSSTTRQAQQSTKAAHTNLTDTSRPRTSTSTTQPSDSLVTSQLGTRTLFRSLARSRTLRTLTTQRARHNSRLKHRSQLPATATATNEYTQTDRQTDMKFATAFSFAAALAFRVVSAASSTAIAPAIDPANLRTTATAPAQGETISPTEALQAIRELSVPDGVTFTGSVQELNELNEPPPSSKPTTPTTLKTLMTNNKNRSEDAGTTTELDGHDTSAVPSDRTALDSPAEDAQDGRTRSATGTPSAHNCTDPRAVSAFPSADSTTASAPNIPHATAAAADLSQKTKTRQHVCTDKRCMHHANAINLVHTCTIIQRNDKQRQKKQKAITSNTGNNNSKESESNDRTTHRTTILPLRRITPRTNKTHKQ